MLTEARKAKQDICGLVTRTDRILANIRKAPKEIVDPLIRARDALAEAHEALAKAIRAPYIK